MTDYTNWKVLKSVINYTGDNEEKQAEAIAAQEEYTAVAGWCNESGKHTIEDVGEYYKVVAVPEPTPPTDDEIRQMRAEAYAAEVDPITAHIQRLRDTEPMTEETQAKIIELIAERDAQVAEIKARYPYNEENDNPEDGDVDNTE